MNQPTQRQPLIALTMGDPAGIGPEIAVRLIEIVQRQQNHPEIIVYGIPEIMEDARVRFAPAARFRTEHCGELKRSDVVPGTLNAACGLAAYYAVRQATLDALSGKVDAIVTCPMNKAAVNEAGIAFTGHTEMIAELCGCKQFAMMQSAGKLHVVFATTHIPLREVSNAITEERILEVTGLLFHALQEEGIESPFLAMAAVNPHAGENGHMGLEEEQIVKPAVTRLHEQGIRVEGPFPPDTLFIASKLDRFDGIVSMYHDQGHIPFKMLAFDRGVNSTLGIPIIRTSVDHGTAFEIAGRGIADIGSLCAALELASIRARNRIRKQKEIQHV